MSRVSFSTLSEFFTDDVGIIRTGVIPYTIRNGKVFWLLAFGPDGKASDFGGGRKKTEKLYSALFRELDEESSGLLTGLVEDCLQKEGADVLRARNGKTGSVGGYLLFVRIPDGDYPKSFRKNKEISKIDWVERTRALRLNKEKLSGSMLQYFRFMERESSR